MSVLMDSHCIHSCSLFTIHWIQKRTSKWNSKHVAYEWENEWVRDPARGLVNRIHESYKVISIVKCYVYYSVIWYIVIQLE